MLFTVAGVAHRPNLLRVSTASSTIISGEDHSVFDEVLTDVNTNGWNGGSAQFRYITEGADAGKTRVRVTADVSEIYWYYIAWEGRSFVSRATLDITFTPWNGTYTQWKWATDTTKLATYAGQAAAILTIA